MANSRTVTIGVFEGKKSIVADSAGAADANVTVTYDREVNQQTVITALEKLREYIIDQEYRKNV